MKTFKEFITENTGDRVQSNITSNDFKNFSNVITDLQNISKKVYPLLTERGEGDFKIAVQILRDTIMDFKDKVDKQ